MQAFISLYSKKQDSNHLKLYTTYSPAHVEFENVFHFWSPNDMHVMCIIYNAVDINKIIVIMN